MTKYCCAPGCLNVWNQNKNITFHRFPMKRPDIMEKWINATKMKTFEANFFAMICSEHFTTDCYTENNLHRRVLKKEAIPTIFKSLNDKAKTVGDKPETSSSGASLGQNESSSDVKPSECKDVPVWFTRENSDDSQRTMLKLKSASEPEQSKLQVLDTVRNGKVFVWNNNFHYSESDGFVVNEMLSFLPLCSHPNPSNVLIVNCGHGGVAKVASKHPKVERIVQLEEDGDVVDFTRKHFPDLTVEDGSSKITLEVKKMEEYVGDHKEEFDVIINVCGNKIPVLKKSLTSDGIMGVFSEGIWGNTKELFENLNSDFRIIKFANFGVPTYDNGSVGVFLATNGVQEDFQKPTTVFNKEDLEKKGLSYYNSKIHSACFALPNFALKQVFNGTG